MRKKSGNLSYAPRNSSDSYSNPDQSKFFLGMINAKYPNHEAHLSNKPPTFLINSFNWSENLDTKDSMIDFKINSGDEIYLLPKTTTNFIDVQN